MARAYISLLHYAAPESAPRWPNDGCALRNNTAPRSRLPLLHSSPDYTPPPTHTHTTDTQLAQRWSKHSSVDRNQGIGIIWYQASRDPAGGFVTVAASPKGGGNDAGEATIDRIASTAEFSDSVRAGKSSKEHQFDSGKKPTRESRSETYISYLVSQPNHRWVT